MAKGLDEGQKGGGSPCEFELGSQRACVYAYLYPGQGAVEQKAVGVPKILMKIKQVSVIFLLMRVGSKNMDETQASISYFLVNEGGSQKYG